MAAKNPCSAVMLAARVAGSDGDTALRTWVDGVRAGVLAHGWSHLPGLGSLAMRERDGARALAFSPNLALLEELNGVTVVSAERDGVVAAIVRALRDGHDAVEVPGLGTLCVDRPAGARACLALEIDAALAAAIASAGISR